MAPVQTRRVKVKASKRALKFLADQAIGHDLFKGLIELITNSDDSYGRLGQVRCQLTVALRWKLIGDPARTRRLCELSTGPKA